MQTVGVIGLGNMGTGMAKNLLKKGFKLMVYDIRDEALREMVELGAGIATSPRHVGEQSQVVFIMVLNGAQVKEVVTGKQGLLEGIKPGATVIVNATILRSIMIEVAAVLEEKGIDVIDCPVSGGQPGAAAGTLTMMAAAKKEVFRRCQDAPPGGGKKYLSCRRGNRNGSDRQRRPVSSYRLLLRWDLRSPGAGNQSRVQPEILYNVISTSMVGNDLFRDTAQHIMDRRFQDAGACIQTMYKDLGITLSMARDSGVPMFTTSTAYQLFQAAYPSGRRRTTGP